MESKKTGSCLFYSEDGELFEACSYEDEDGNVTTENEKVEAVN